MKIENYKSFILFSFLILLSCNNLTRRKSGHGRVCKGYIVANKIKLIYYGLKCNILHDAFSLNKIGIKGENNNDLFPSQGHLTLELP